MGQMPATPSAKSWRHRLRVSVRALMILVLLLAIGLSWTVYLGRIVHSAQLQREAVAAIKNAGGFVLYEWDREDGRPITSGRQWYSEWVVDRLGVDYFGDVVEVYLRGGLSDANLALVGRFPRLLELHCFADRSSPTDTGLAHLDGITGLKQLDLSGTRIADGGLVHSRTGITDAGLAHLKGMTRLEKLNLSGTGITDAGLVHLKGMTGLQELNLSNTSVNGTGMVHLKGLTSLQSLDLQGTKVDDFGAQEVRRALPKVKFSYTHIWAR